MRHINQNILRDWCTQPPEPSYDDPKWLTIENRTKFSIEHPEYVDKCSLYMKEFGIEDEYNSGDDYVENDEWYFIDCDNPKEEEIFKKYYMSRVPTKYKWTKKSITYLYWKWLEHAYDNMKRSRDAKKQKNNAERERFRQLERRQCRISEQRERENLLNFSDYYSDLELSMM